MKTVMFHTRMCDLSKMEPNSPNFPALSYSVNFPVCFTYTLGKINSKCNSHTLMRYRCFKRFYLNNFQNHLSTSKLTGSTPDRSLKHFYEIVNGTLNKHAPIKIKEMIRALI